MIQKSFNFPHTHFYTADDFIVTNTNRLGFEKIVGWPRVWSNASYPYFLLLYGDARCGKTHLANIWKQRADAEFFAADNIDLLDRYTNIIIENIDSANWSENDLLYVFNFCNESKRYCLFTSQIFPLNFNLADLSSRVKSIDSIGIGRPDKETVKMILRKEFSKQSLQIEQKLIDFLADIIPLNFDSAHQAVNLLNKTSLTTGKTINSALIKQLFLT